MDTNNVRDGPSACYSPVLNEERGAPEMDQMLSQTAYAPAWSFKELEPYEAQVVHLGPIH